MRVLVLVDHPSDLEAGPELTVFGHLEDVTARRDLALMLPHLNSQRVQTQVCTMYGAPTEGSLSLRLRGRFDPAMWSRLVRVLKAGAYDLIHALGVRAALCAGIAGRMAGVPSLATFYRADTPIPAQKTSRNGPTRRSFNQWLDGWLIRKTVIRFVAISELVRRDLWRQGFPEGDIEVIYPGFVLSDPARELPTRAELGLPEGPLVTLVAGFDESQGHAVFLDSLPRLQANVPAAHFAIAGRGTPADRLRVNQQIHKRSIIPPVLLAESIDMRDVIASSQVIVIHPFAEGIPLAAIEAGAMSKPVVSSRVAGVTELIEQDVTGLLVTPGDARDLTVQIGRLIQQPNYMRDMGIRAQQRIRDRFSIESQAQHMTITYEETIYSTR